MIIPWLFPDVVLCSKITIADIKQLYNARQHPLVKTGQMTEEQVFKEFLNNFDSPVTDGVITAEEFEVWSLPH